MRRGRRYSQEQHLNYTKVFAVIIAIVVIAMCIVIIKNLLSKHKETIEQQSKDYYALYTDDKWGVIDSTGNTVIEPMYQEMIIVLNNRKDVFLCTYDETKKQENIKQKL